MFGMYTEREVLAFQEFGLHPLVDSRFRTRCYSADKGCTKLAALREDMMKLHAKDALAHVVVFTHFVDTHFSVVAMLDKDTPFEVHTFTGGTCARKRHDLIRSFQKVGARPKVFVITIGAGAAGITLTAATRIYLMEPCMDPATEMQVAGRIHRLGQGKEVLLKRFVFRNSIEENICKLHQKLQQGTSDVLISNGKITSRGMEILFG